MQQASLRLSLCAALPALIMAAGLPVLSTSQGITPTPVAATDGPTATPASSGLVVIGVNIRSDNMPFFDALGAVIGLAAGLVTALVASRRPGGGRL